MTVKRKITKTTDSALYWWKIIQMVIGASALAVAFFVHYVGPGIKDSVRDFTGNTEVVNRIDDEILPRIEMMEANMPPPKTVTWNASQSYQAVPCDHIECNYILTASATPFRLLCGDFSKSEVEVRLEGSGRTVKTRYADSFVPVELTMREDSFVVPIVIHAGIPDGKHDWKVNYEYENCPGPNEPQQRSSPYFPLVVDRTERR